MCTGQRHRPLRRLPGRLSRACPPLAPLGARRLAARAVARPRRARRRRGAHREPAVEPRPLEDTRQSAPQPRSDLPCRTRRGRLADAARQSLGLDDPRRRGARRPPVHRPRHGPCPRTPSRRGAQHAAPPGRPWRALAPGDRLPAQRRGGRPRRDRVHAVAAVRVPATPSRMDVGRPCGEPPRGEVARRRRASDVGRAGRFGRDRRGAGGGAPGGAAAGGASPPPVVPVARDRGVDQPAAPAAGGAAPRPGPRLPAPAGAAHLALLRGACRSRRQLASTGQFPGGAVPGSRPPHIADQYRHDAALLSHRLGLRPCRLGGFRRPQPQRPRHARSARTLPRTPAQLVRHAAAGAARAALCLDG